MDLATAASLVHQRRPDLDLSSAQLSSPGWDFDVLISDEWVFRFPRRAQVATKLSMEVVLLPALRPRLAVAVPRIEVQGVLSDGRTRWAGYRRIAGEPVTAELFGSTRGGLARSQIAGVLAALADVSVREARDIGVPVADVGSWWRAREAVSVRIRAEVLPLLDGDTAACASALLGRPLPADFAPTLLHGDFHRGHLLADDARGLLHGVIDWSDAQVGDPALEAAQLIEDLPEPVVAELLPPYADDDDDFWIRARAYRRRFPLEEVLHGLDTGERRFVDRGVREAAALFRETVSG
ncbi:MAG TPA: phosphotransferase [Mycobacteriales bacterium]|nr:phosphotransferase [Mycobacteriales bacterium]